MKINPKNIFWRGSTQRTDGTAIPGPLDYDIGTDTGAGVNHLATIVGTLQTDGLYVAPISDFSFGPGTHTIALRATERATGLTSAWSTEVTFQLVDAVPSPPNALAVE